jgi:hypothetical protein
MKGLFNKLINKFNDPSNQSGSKSNTSSQSQKPVQNQNPKSNQTNIINLSNNTPPKELSSNIPTNNPNLNTIPNNLNNITDNLNMNKPKPDNQIVIVNERQVDNKLKGYYYKKHIDDIRKLKISEPIIYQRQKMKVNFDIDILDYLFNDMTEIFKMKSNIVEENKNELIKKINETYDLVNILNDFNKNSDDILNKYMKQKKIMDNVEMMEIFVKSLSQEVDDLLLDITKFEVKMKKEMEEQEKKEK